MSRSFKFTVAVLLTVALAGMAFAGPFRSLDKPVVKQSAVELNRGMLDCSNVIEVSLNNTYYGDNTGAPNNVTTYGCSTWDESGGEVVFHLYLDTPAMFEAFITPDGCDLDMAVLDQCDEDLGCLIVADSGVETSSPLTGDFYFVVDGYAGAACTFTFTINELAPPEPVGFCDAVDVVTVQNGEVITGDTCDGVNNIASLDCGSYTENGLEDYYEIVMPAGSTITATVTYDTADGALWLLDGCSEPFSCLAYADDTLDGDSEVISYTNTSGADMVVYLVVDSWGTDACGTYTLEFASDGGAVANEMMSFGAVKALYN